jgi:hypothetical protein
MPKYQGIIFKRLSTHQEVEVEAANAAEAKFRLRQGGAVVTEGPPIQTNVHERLLVWGPIEVGDGRSPATQRAK